MITIIGIDKLQHEFIVEYIYDLHSISYYLRGTRNSYIKIKPLLVKIYTLDKDFERKKNLAIIKSYIYFAGQFKYKPIVCFAGQNVKLYILQGRI